MPGPQTVAPFIIHNVEESLFFVPVIYPETLRVRKQRNLDRQENFCGGEDVSDTGSKNRDVHIVGVIRGRDVVEDLNEIADAEVAFEMSSATWSGEIRIKELEIEGPDGYYPPTHEMYWQYTLDAVSTGLDEEQRDNGVIDDGSSSDDSTDVSFAEEGI